MALIPVSREQHGGKFLRPLTSFAHAAGTAATEVVMSELAQVTACYPTFFIRQGNDYKLIALLGLVQGENLHVDMGGSWTGLYIPATIRAYPFSLARGNKPNELTVLYDDVSGLISDSEGEPLFGNEQGEPNGPLARVIQLLTQLNIEGARTQQLAGQLAAAGLLKEAAIKVERGGKQQDLAGIFAVDEKTLGELADTTFLELRRSGALALAYAQMLSLGQLGRLQAKASMRDQGRDSAAFS